MDAPRRVAPAILLLGAGVIASALFLAVSAALFERSEIAALDDRALIAILAWRGPLRDAIAADITSLGSTTLLIVFVAIAAVAEWRVGDRVGAAQVIVALVGAGVADDVAKQVFARPRPTVIPHLVEVSGYSFPSGHAFSTAAVYATFAILYHRRVRDRTAGRLIVAAAVAIIAAVALSRVYLGVHNPSDVVAGVAAGTGWALLTAAAFSWLRGRLRPPRVSGT